MKYFSLIEIRYCLLLSLAIIMTKEKRINKKPPFIMWVVIGIGAGALIGGALFKNFVFGAGIGVGIGILLGLWAEHISKKMSKDK